MIEVRKEGVLLEKSGQEFENMGVLNPAAIYDGTFIHMFYRAVRNGNNSTIGYCKLSDPMSVVERSTAPLLVPGFKYESHGVEDPRIVRIDGTYYLTYTAYDGVNALGALAVSQDLIHFDKKGIIVPQVSYTDFCRLLGDGCIVNKKYLRYNEKERLREKDGTTVFVWDKNVIFFPEKINGKFIFLHRIKPDIQIVSFNSFDELTPEFWTNYFSHFSDHIVMTAIYPHEVSYIGGGCPPIKTDSGWLLIYHAVHDTLNGYVYSACAALLDINNPQREIARLPYPLFRPDQNWELTGEVNNVCFPTGAVVLDGTLFIYYGAADEQIACASINLQALLNELLLNTL